MKSWIFPTLIACLFATGTIQAQLTNSKWFTRWSDEPVTGYHYDLFNAIEGFNETQIVGVEGNASSAATFSITFQGHKTAELAVTSSAAAVQAALQALPSIGNGNVTVTLFGASPNPVYRIEFVGALAQTNVPECTTSSTTLILPAHALAYTLQEDAPQTQWSVVPLDGQAGLDLSADQVPNGLNPWYKKAALVTHDLPRKIHARPVRDGAYWRIRHYPYQYPIASFGTGSEKSPLYVGKSYRFALVAGAQTPFLDTAGNSELAIFTFDKATGQLVSQTDLDLPNIPNASGLNPATGEQAEDVAEWQNFAEGGFQRSLNVVINGQTVLETTVQYVPTRADWQRWGALNTPSSNTSAFPLFLTHRAASKDYGFVVGYKSSIIAGNTSVPYTGEEFYPGGGSVLSQGSFGYAYAMDFDEPQPWQTTLLQTPQFNGKPLPPSYIGKTAEEIEHLSPELAAEFGNLFEGIRWTSLFNMSTSGGGSGGTELSKNGGTASVWDANALAEKVFYEDGIAQFRFKSGCTALLGFGSHAWSVTGNQVEALEQGALTGIKMGYTEADVFSIQRQGVVVRYLKNGEPWYTSAAPNLGRVQVNVLGSSLGNLILSARYFGAIDPDVDKDGMEDVWEEVYVLKNPADEIFSVSQFAPGADFDDDGVSNLQEFLDGTDAASTVSKALAVSWTSHVNTTSQGVAGGLSKTAGTSVYDADAVGSVRILEDGKVTFRAVAGSHVLLGFNISNNSRDYADLDYAWHPRSTGLLGIWEGSTKIMEAGTWTPSTVLTIQRIGDQIFYLKDNVLVYTSTVKTRQPLIVDTAFMLVGSQVSEARYVTGDNDGDGIPDTWEVANLSPGATEADVAGFLPSGDADGDGISNLQEYQDGTNASNALSRLETVVWTSHRNTQSVGSSGGLKKTAGTNDWSGDAVASKRLIGDGEVRFVPGQTTSWMMVGFSPANAVASSADASHAILVNNTTSYQVYESGVAIAGTTGTYSATTEFRVVRTGETVKYYVGGAQIYESPKKCPGKVFIDCNLYNINDTLAQCRYSNGDADNDGLSDVWELAQLAPGAGYADVAAFSAGADSDGDSITDAQELANGTDPLNALSRLETVVWTSHVNTTSQGSAGGLRKTGGAAAYDADAVGTKPLLGDGLVSFKVASGSHVLVGLNAYNQNRDYADLDYSFHPKYNGVVEIYESGAVKLNVGTYDSNTVFVIERVGDLIRYWKNGALVYTSATRAYGSFVMDTAFRLVNSEILETYIFSGDVDGDGMLDSWELAHLPSASGLTELTAFLSTDDADGDGRINLEEFRDGTNPNFAFSRSEALVWTSHVNTTSQGIDGGLKKTSGSNTTYDADAVSNKRLLGDGKVTFRVKEGSHQFVGLNYDNTNRSWQEIDYAWHTYSNSLLEVYESGTLKFAGGTWNEGTLLAIERVGDTVRYLKDGVVVYVSATKSYGAILVDTAFYPLACEILEARLVSGDLDGDGLPDVWELGQLSSGATFTDLQNYTAAVDSDGDGVSDAQEYIDRTDPSSLFSNATPVTWTARVNTTVQGVNGGLRKTAGSGSAYDGDAISNTAMPKDGSLTVKAAAGSRLLVGFNQSNTSRSYEELDYCVFFNSTGAAEVYESGVMRAALGSWNASTVLSIERIGNLVRYRKDGVVMYDSVTKSGGTLFVDTSFFNLNAELTLCRFSNGDVDNDGMADAWELAFLGSGAGLTELQGYTASGDADNDGSSNLNEFLDGSDPANATSSYEPVTWTLEDGTLESANGKLIKTGAPMAENDSSLSYAGAVGEKVILGDGALKFKFESTGKYAMVGFGTNNSSTRYEDIEFGIYAFQDNRLQIFESGVERGNFGSYTPEDNFEIRRNGSVITYWKNGVKIYTSLVPSSGALTADASIYTLAAGVSECRISGATVATSPNSLVNGWLEPVNWINHDGATEGVGGALTRTGNPSAAGDATAQFSGAISKKVIPGTGRLWFRFGQANLHAAVGLSKDEADKKSTKRTDLDYAIAGDNTGRLHIYESGADVGDFGPYTSDDFFEIRRNASASGAVSYWKNGVKLRDATTSTQAALFVDAAINSANAAIAECRHEGAASANAILDQLVAAEQQTADLLSLDASPELRVHPILDAFVEAMGGDPMALANFVLNDIEVTDAIGLNDRGQYDEASLNAAGINRGALGVYLERQGSPAEQCSLLVYLLRRAGYPATYVFPAPNSLTLLDGTVSKILRTQVKGALRSDGTTNVPHEIPVNYPWVAFYKDGEWVHLFPWIKDTEIKEGLNLWDYMPEAINSPSKWIRAYIYKQSSVYDADSAKESPMETLKRKFEAHLQANHPGKTFAQFGYSTNDRKHYHTRWQDFPRPWSLDLLKTPTLISNLAQMAGVFDTFEIQIKGVAPSTGAVSNLQKIGPFRTLDFHNRRMMVNSTDSAMTITLEPFRPGTTTTSTFFNEPALINRQQITISTASAAHEFFQFEVLERRHRYIHPLLAASPLGDQSETFLQIGEGTVITKTLGVNRKDLCAFCPNAGRVTPQMVRIHLEESWKNNLAASPNDQLGRELVAYVMGMTYHQRTGESQRKMLELLKLSRVSVRSFGFGSLAANPQAGGAQMAPLLDMLNLHSVIIGGGAFRPDAGGQHVLLDQEFYGLFTLDASALEHLTIRKFFPEVATDAISTVELLHRTPVGQIIELTPQNYESIGEENRTFVHPVNSTSTTRKVREWAGGQWASIQQAFAPGAWDREFVRVFITPGPVSGAANTWHGVGALIVGRNEAAALIGKRLNGGYAGPVTHFNAANWTRPGTLTIEEAGYASLRFNPISTVSNDVFFDASTSIANSIRNMGSVALGNVSLDSRQYASAQNYVFNTNVGSLNSSQQSTLLINSTNYGNFGNGGISNVNLVSDPVNALTGEFYVDTLDLSLPGGAMPLQIRRNYSSRNLADNSFGYGWKLSLMPYLLAEGDSDQKIYAAEMNGNVIAYTRDGSTNRWNVKWEDNPELNNTDHGRLHYNYILKTTESGKTIYRLYGHEGSVREFEVRTYPVSSGSTTINRQRPYLRKWSDHAGNYYEFTFYNTSGTSEYGQVRRIQCSNGSFVNFNYDINGHVTEIFTSDSRRLQYRYNDYGDLTEVIRPDGSSEKYGYALQEEVVNTTTNKKEWISTHLMIKETKPEGRVIINEYEMDSPTKYATSGRVTRQFSNVGKASTNTAVDQPVPAANSNDPVAESYQPRLSARFNYANLTQNATTKKWTGYVEIFDAYDRKTVYHFVDNRLEKTVDALGYTESVEYYADSGTQPAGGYRRSIKKRIDKRGLITEYKYDAAGNPNEVTVTGDLDGNPATTESATSTTTYNARNLPTQSVAPDPVTGLATGRVTTIAYNYAADPYLPTEIKVSLGGATLTKTVTGYGDVGAGSVPFARGLAFSTSVGVDGDMAMTSMSYNRSGLLTESLQYSGANQAIAPNVITRYRYNLRQELEETEDAAGRKTRYAYDNMGRRIWEERLDAAGVQKGWNYVYYNQNGEVEWTDGPRYAPEDFTYARCDGMGRAVEEVMWRSRARADGTGVEEVPGADLYATVKKTYNLFGDLIKTMDPRGNTTRLFYDATGRPTESRVYEGDWENGGAMLAKSSTTYNSELDGLGIPRDKSVTATGPNGGVTTTWHTQAGKPWKQENPDGTVLGWEYYLDGRTKKEPVGPSTYVLYEYQDATRQVTKTLKNYAGNILGQPQVTTANSRGQVVSATDAAGNIVTSTYDQVGRPLEAFQPKAASDPNPALLASRQIYDAAGVVAIAENALGQRTVTEHDALGRPVRTQVREANQAVVQESSIVYLAGQHGVSTTSGVANTATAISSTAYTDNAGKGVLAINPGGSFSRTEYDAAGNAVAVHTAADLNGVAGFETTTTTTSYDGANRPRTTTLPDGAQVTMHYAYVTQGSGVVVSPSPTDVILGTVVEKRMPSPAASSALAPVQGGFIEYQRLDSSGRLVTKSIKAGDGTSTREQTNYVYFPANAGKNAGLLQSYQQQVTTSGFRSHVYVYDEWRRVQTYTCGTSGQADHVVRTFSYDDPRSLVTDLREDTRDGYTIVHRDYDAQTRVTSETVSMDGSVIRHLTNGYDAAGRRSRLEKGSSIADLGVGAGGSFAFAWQANGALKSVTADGKVFEYSYANNGLIAGRSNPWRSYVVNQRDNRGRLTQATTSVVGLPGALLQETLTWLDDNRQSSYVASRAALPGGPAAQTDARYYGYDVERRRLVSESYTPVTGVAQNLNFQYDFGFAGLGIRTSATQGSSPTADFRSYVAPGDTGATSKFARVLRQTSNEKVHDITATGNAFGAASVTASLEKVGSLPNVSHPGWQHPVGNWSVPLRLWPGDHSLEATAHHPGGTFNTSATSNFSLARLEEQISNTYDEEGNVIQRSWSLSGRTQVLTWDGQGRLLAVTDRDADQHGINWQARYDGLGRRLRTVTQTVRFGGVVGDAVQEDSWYDPLHEFLEVAVETNIGGADGKRTWKVHGPDANGNYGDLQGIGGFEATVDEAVGSWTAVVDDYYGHIVATVDGGVVASVSWQVTRCASYGPQPGSPVPTLAHGLSVALSTNWRGERMDITGFYYLGARYYDPMTGMFNSPDPLGHGASMGLYAYVGGDPVNLVDSTGRLQKSSYPGVRTSDLLGPGILETLRTLNDTFAKEVKANYLHRAPWELIRNTQVTMGFNVASQMGLWASGDSDPNLGPLPNAEITPYQLFAKWVSGTGDQVYRFNEKSYMGQQILRADYVQQAVSTAVKNAENHTYTPVRFAFSLGKESKAMQLLYPFRFFWDVVLGTQYNGVGVNPTKAFMGSLAGVVKIEPDFVLSTDSQIAYRLNIRMVNDMTSISATRYPPFLGGYLGRNRDGKQYPNALYTMENPHGPNAPASTFRVVYDLEIIRYTSWGFDEDEE